MNKNNIVLVLDASGSMQNCYKNMIKNVQNMLKSIKENDKNFNQETNVTLITFDTTVRYSFKNVPSKNLDKYKNFKYELGGLTALFDAFGTAVDSVTKADSQLVVVFTDGGENASTRYNITKVQNLIKQKQKDGNWTLAFNVPPGNKTYFVGLGVPEANVREWESTNIDSVKETGEVNTSSLNTYYRARSTGNLSVSNYFTTDLTQLKVSQVRQELDNISKDFIEVNVDTEAQIRDVVEQKVGNFVKGNAFYQLVKPELVQENKELLVMEKGKKAIWGGQDARDVLGLPAGRVKVTPGNHGKYEIFVQSTSVNRKTVPGTKILVRK